MHVAAVAAPTRAAGVTIAMIAIVTPKSVVCSERARTFTPSRPSLAVLQLSVVDFVDGLSGRVFPVRAGTACTVAKMFGPDIPGNLKAPNPVLLQPIWYLSNAVIGVWFVLTHRPASGALPAALIAWIASAVELVSDGCPAAAM